MTSGATRQKGIALWVKRAVDVAASGAALVSLAPLMATVAAGIAATMGRPVLFAQRRPGKGGRVFTTYKFRTMREVTGSDGQPLADAERLTALGRVIRRTSLDELPQLWNVLSGDMSLVGPRPLLVQYLPRYSPEQRRRHDVLPGMTGWAQVNGRNATSWPERLAQDVWYVEHWSLALDAKILLMTAWKVLRREGISQPGHDTMSEFTGDEERQEAAGEGHVAQIG